VLVLAVALACATQVSAQTDPLPSWNDGAAKNAIVEFVQTTTTQGSPNFVTPAERIATFDQDGTLWVEHPMYTQVANTEVGTFYPATLRRGEEEGLDGRQHEERLERHFLI
jgi:hypothetical protein